MMSRHSQEPLQRHGTPERASVLEDSTISHRSLRQRVAAARGGGSRNSGGGSRNMRSLQFRARWAVCAEALDAAVLQYDFAGQFVQLIDERRSPLEWRDNTAWADTGGWRLTATHSGELVDESRAEARQDITVHLDDVCPNVQSLFFVVCARDSTVGRAISRPQVELRALEHGGGSVDLPTLLPLGNAAATAGSAVVCRVWRSSIADSWVAERVGLPAPAVDEDEYDRLIDAVATWLSVQMSARSTLDNPPPRAQSPHRAIAAEPFAAVAPGGASAVATDASGNSKPRRVAVRANGARQSEPHRMSEDGVEAREQLEEELSQLREKLAQSKESQHAAVQQVERLKKANHELQALIRTQRTESETARKTAADSHAAEMVLLTQRRRSAAAARQRKVAASPTQQLSASPAVDADRSEVTDDHSQQMLLAELQALQMEHDAKCEELACCQTQLNSSKARADKAERELQEHRERRDNEAVDAIMAPCTAERVASLETFLEEEKASKRELETERDALRGEKKCWNKERRKMISLETKLREQIRDLKGKVAQEAKQVADLRAKEAGRRDQRVRLERERSKLADQQASFNLEKERHARERRYALDYSKASAQESLIGILEGSGPSSPVQTPVSRVGGESKLGAAVDALEQLLGGRGCNHVSQKGISLGD